jgi:hypothetical protein
VYQSKIEFSCVMFFYADAGTFLREKKDFDRKIAPPSNDSFSLSRRPHKTKNKPTYTTMPLTRRSSPQEEVSFEMPERLMKSTTCSDVHLPEKTRCDKCVKFAATGNPQKQRSQYTDDRYKCDQPWDESWLDHREHGKRVRCENARAHLVRHGLLVSTATNETCMETIADSQMEEANESSTAIDTAAVDATTVVDDAEVANDVPPSTPPERMSQPQYTPGTSFLDSLPLLCALNGISLPEFQPSFSSRPFMMLPYQMSSSPVPASQLFNKSNEQGTKRQKVDGRDPAHETQSDPSSVLTPVSKAMSQLGPRKAKSALADRKAGTIQWQEAAASVGESAVAKEASKLEWLLNVISNKITSTATRILEKLLQRSSMSSITEQLVRSFTAASNDANAKVVAGIKSFLEHHTSRGSRIKEQQDAVDAVLVASTFALEPGDSYKALAEKIRARPDALSNAHVWAKKMIAENKKFTPKERQKRSDCYRDEARACVREFCHDEGSNVDTESYRVYKIKDPDTGVVANHPARVWNETTHTKRYESFKTSNAYREFQANNNGRTIGKEVFRLEVCECVRNPSPQSCVDLHMSALSEYMKAIRSATMNFPAIKKRLEECNCERHTRSRQDDTYDAEPSYSTGTMWEDLLAKRPVDLIQATCCPAIEEKTLEYLGTSSSPPRQIPWRCTHFGPDKKKCDECGIDRMLRIKDCKALSECDTVIPVREWTLQPREGKKKNGEPNTQIELSEEKYPMSNVVKKLIEQLETCRKHYKEYSWINLMRRIDTNTFKANELNVYTDFSASLNLRADQAICGATDRHAVLAIFVILHSRRDVTVQKDGKDVSISVNECDVWYFFGDTLSKGKKNDYVFHNACLEHIAKHYRDEYEQAGKPPINLIRVWTDNCAGQYKCRHNFWRIATFPSRVAGIRIVHRFAQKYQFKGVWDAAGKVIKELIRQLELENKRLPSAWKCVEQLTGELEKPKSKNAKKDWKGLEEKHDAKILEKSPFMVSNRFIGYGTEKKTEFDQLTTDGHKHIVFTDRENKETMSACKGTQALHEVTGFLTSREGRTGPEWKLQVSNIPCSCVYCRGAATDGGECKFKYIQESREIWVKKIQRREQNPQHKETFDAWEVILRQHFGNEVKLTCDFLKGELRAKGLPVSGRKHELAERLGRYLQEQQANAANDGNATNAASVYPSGAIAQFSASGAVLATSMIDDDDDLMVNEDEDIEEDEEEDGEEE